MLSALSILDIHGKQFCNLFQIWCATGVNLSGGRTKDGGNIVGASVFYSNNSSVIDSNKTDEIDREIKGEMITEKDVSPEVEEINKELKVTTF